MGESRNPLTGTEAGPTPVPLAESHESAQSVEQKFLDHFGLNEQPFGVTPDTRFLYLGPKHRQALAALNYGTESNRGFLTLIAPPGLGKTTLLFNYLEGLRTKARTAFLFQTDCDSRDLMAYLLTELGLDARGKDLPEMHAMLNQVLKEEMRLGRPFVLVIDEAQNLSEKVLESVRLLSNFETPWMKLMQIVLAGQPQLAERLAKPSMAQLQQRISFAVEIEPLSSDEVTAYVDHRLWVAGYKGPSLFSIGARTLLAEQSEGIPRKINNMCFCAMSLAWATKHETIDREMMRDVLAEMHPGALKGKPAVSPKPIKLPKQIDREKLRDVLAEMNPGAAKNKPAVSPKLLDLPKQSVVQHVRPAVLTVKEPPARSWLPTAVFTCVVLLALVWSVVHMDIGKRFIDLWHGMPAAKKSFVVPARSPASLDSEDPSLAGASSPGPSSETLTNDKNEEAPQQGEVKPTSSKREPN